MWTFFGGHKPDELVDYVKKLVLSDVSRKCDIAYSTLRDLYVGKNKTPLASTLEKLSIGLDIEIDDLLEKDIKPKMIDKIKSYFSKFLDLTNEEKKWLKRQQS